MVHASASRIATVVLATAMLAACSGGSQGSATPQPVTPGPVSTRVCNGYTAVQRAADDLRSEPLDVTAPPEEVQQQLASLSGKAIALRASLDRLAAVSDGPVAAAVGAMNQKADALQESLTEARYNALETVGPKVTKAKSALDAAYTDLTTSLDAVCPAG